jgi:pyridoxine kinase
MVSSTLPCQTPLMNVLSIQSWVSYGHVGNASAAFPLQRLGAEVWAINTVQFSNHPGYGDWTGEATPAALVRSLLDGIERRGAFARCDAVLSGYLGNDGVGEAVLDAVRRVRRAHPSAVYCCDPVIGDEGPGVYVASGIPDLIREQAIPAADIATPNQFELGELTGLNCATRDGAKRAVAALQARMRPGGPRAVLLTSFRTGETPGDCIELLAAEAGRFHLLRTPLLPGGFNGAGDAIAALFLFHHLRSGCAVVALEAAAASVYGLLRHTAEAGQRELLLVAAQEEIVRPTQRFTSQPC